MKPLYRIILLMTAIITSFYVSADSQGQLKFHSLSVNDGLSQHDITDIVEDSFGFIWIATYDGLNRYDGKRIRIFRHSTGVRIPCRGIVSCVSWKIRGVTCG